MNILEYVKDVIKDMDIAQRLTTVTFTGGMVHAFGWIENNIGLMIAVISIVLHIKITHKRNKKMDAEIELMKAQTDDIKKSRNQFD